MSNVLRIVSRLEQVGGKLLLTGDRIEYTIPKSNQEAQALLAELRKHREGVTELLRQRTHESGENWPPESQEAVRKFGQSHARLFPFIGHKVRTPEGPGTLIQVFAGQVTVLLDCELDKCAWFHPKEVTPVVSE